MITEAAPGPHHPFGLKWVKTPMPDRSIRHGLIIGNVVSRLPGAGDYRLP
jgi:hypothetical protein